MKWNRMLALLLALVLVWPCAFPVKAARNQGAAEKYNIVIVTDCSKSLVDKKGNCSDPEGYRYEAISMFLGLLTDSGNNVSAIVFNGTMSDEDNSDESMRSGLRLNTELEPLNGKAAKQALVDRIKAVRPEDYRPSYTDIGTALLAAAEKLDGMTEKNGLKSIILLFTDGYTQTGDIMNHPNADPEDLPVYSQSVANSYKAVELIKANGIKLCGIYLQGKSSGENSELLNLIRLANGADEEADKDRIEDLYIPVTEASSLQATYKQFFTMISGTETEPFQGEKEFTIPGMGVTDVNICVLVSGDRLEDMPEQLKKVKVTVTRQDGTELSSGQMSQSQYQGKNFLLYKLQKPEPGVWTVRVDAPEDVQLESSLLINADVSASMVIEGNPEFLPINESLEVFAQLQQEGKGLPNAEAYRQYECFLEVYREGETEIKQVPLVYQADENGFLYKVMVEHYGTYNARVLFRCGDTVRVVSETETWRFPNVGPEAPELEEIPVTLGLFSQGVAVVDLETLVKDDENIPEENIIVSYGRYDASACTREGNILTIDAAVGGSGSIYVTYRDIGGAEVMTQLKIVYTDNSMRDIMVLCGVLALVALVYCLLRWLRKKRMKLKGKLVLDVPIGEQPCPLQLNAQECLTHSLYSLLRKNAYALTVQAERKGYSAEQVEAFLKQYRRVLSGVRIESARDKSSTMDVCRVIGAEGKRSVRNLKNEEMLTVALEGRKLPLRLKYNRFEYNEG